MTVTMTDEKHAELVRMLDTIVRGCDAHAYDIGLSLDPLRDLLGEVAALTREPAPIGPDSFAARLFEYATHLGSCDRYGFDVPSNKCPCSCGFDGIAHEARTVIGREALAPSASACQCRELLREAATHVHCDHDSGEHTCIALKIDAALAQPCAAPGEAGEWSEAGLVTHKFKAHYDVAGSCTEPLSNIAQDGDYIRVYEPRYRRRAPEREGGAK